MRVAVTLGIDVACRADHQASLADERGEFVWSGARFATTVGLGRVGGFGGLRGLGAGVRDRWGCPG